MAFTQEQKNNLEVLEKTPEIFLEKIKDGRINLSEYKDEYARGGIGLSHYLIDFLIKDVQKYKAVADEIWNNSPVSIADFYKENQTPIDYAFSIMRNLSHFYGDNKESLNTLFDIVQIAPSKINDEDFSHALYTFFMNEEFDKFNLLLDKRKKVVSNIYWEKIFEKIITENDLPQLKNIASRIEDKDDLTRVQWALPMRNKGMNHEKSSLLVCAIRYSDDIANYFLDEFKFPLNGRVKFDMPSKNNYTDLTSEANLYRDNFPSGMRHEKRFIYSATHPLNESREMEKLDIFNKIIDKLGKFSIPNLMYEEKITKKIIKQKSIYSYSSRTDEYEPSKSILNHILANPGSEFYQTIKTNINSIVKDNTNINKGNFISQILENKNLELKEKNYFAKAILPIIGKFEKIKDDYSSRRTGRTAVSYILDTFLKDLYNKKTISFKDINYASEILGLALKNPNPAFSNAVFYSNELYSNNALMNGFIAAGLDVTKDYYSNKKVNPFSFYYQLKSRGYGYSAETAQEDIEKIHKNFNTLKLIAGDNLYLPIPAQDYGHNVPNKNLLNYALSKLAPILIDNFTDEEIIKFAHTQPEIYPVSSIATPYVNEKNNQIDEKQLETYRQVTKRMFNLGFNFFNEDKPDDFYKLLSFQNDMDFISDVLNKENKNIPELSKDINFWKHVNNEEISQYVTDKGADLSSLEMTLNIADLEDFDRKVFELYINRGGNIKCNNEDKDNILHYLVKNELYKQASHVINLYPELSEEVNKQNKIPLQYMMVSLNKEANPKNYSKSAFFPAQKEFFENYLDVGKFSDNKKSLKFLNEQISKYGNIENLVPNLKEIMSYKIIDAITKPDPNEKKTTVRNKI
jgi:hypothetical protein